jgi:hypothetical protein
MQTAAPTPESHVGGVLAIVLLIVGAGLAYFLTPILSVLLALITLYCGWKFFKWRVDPADMFFWMKSKPSWAAVGLTWLCGLLLIGISYAVFKYTDHGLWLSPYLNGKL